LLCQYAQRRSNDAFATLVNRYLNLVYSVALRQVRSPHLAQEVAQSVFSDLARNAATLKADTVLTAWLYRVAYRTAIDVVRHESRRQAREQIATEMAAMNTASSEWTGIEPLLDEAMETLEEQDRTAILLRYFDNKSLRDVGQALGISEDAAQKRVSRAVDQLRDLFSKRGVVIGAGGLAVVISANAVQAAPTGLAATISAAAVLAGITTVATTTATVTKAIAMAALQKTLVTATIAVTVSAGIYEARQASTLRQQVQTLQQQQASLSGQVQQLRRERNDASSQLAEMSEENERLNRNTDELLKLRGQAVRLQTDGQRLPQSGASDSSDSTETTTKSWLTRVNQLKQYVDKNPNEKIPEFEFLTDREWLVVADAPLRTGIFEKEDDYRHAMELLRIQAENRFGIFIQIALQKYATATNGQFPTSLSQLQPYCEPPVYNVMLDLYEIKPAAVVKDFDVDSDWVVTRKVRVNRNSTSRLAIFADGNGYWQSPPGNND